MVAAAAGVVAACSAHDYAAGTGTSPSVVSLPESPSSSTISSGQSSERGGSAAATSTEPTAAQLCRASIPRDDLLSWASATVGQFRQYQYGGPTPIRPLGSAFAGLAEDTPGAWCAVKVGAETTRWWAVVKGRSPQRLIDITGPGEGKAHGAVRGPEQVP